MGDTLSPPLGCPEQKFSFSNFCPGRGLNPGPRSLMAVHVTTRLRRHPNLLLESHGVASTKCLRVEQQLTSRRASRLLRSVKPRMRPLRSRTHSRAPSQWLHSNQTYVSNSKNVVKRCQL